MAAPERLRRPFPAAGIAWGKYTEGHPRPALLPVIAKMLESGDNAIQESEAVDAINAVNYDGQAIVDQAVAHGGLTVISTGVVSFGIPSFHTHMVAELERNAKRKTPSPSSPRLAAG